MPITYAAKCCLTCSACVPVSTLDGECRAGPPTTHVVGMETSKVIGPDGKPRSDNKALFSAVWPTLDLDKCCRDGWQQAGQGDDVPGRADALNDHFPNGYNVLN